MKKIHEKKIQILIFTAIVTIAGLFSFQSGVKAAGIAAGDVVNLVNKERKSDGLAALSRSSVLDRAAKDKANDMIKNDYFAHTSPAGVDPWYWFEKEGYDYKYAGENLAINYTEAKEQNEAWMKSPTHRKNILNPLYKETGVAVVEGKINGENSILTVQVFGTKVVAVATAQKTELPEKTQAVAGEEKLPEVFSTEKIMAESPLVAGVPIDFVSQQKVVEQLQPVKNFLDSNSAIVQIVVVAVLIVVLLLIKTVKLHKIS